jgi:hypothetical protein
MIDTILFNVRITTLDPNTGGKVSGEVLTCELGGKQYVATTSGVVSGFFGGSGTSSIIVFALH